MLPKPKELKLTTPDDLREKNARESKETNLRNNLSAISQKLESKIRKGKYTARSDGSIKVKILLYISLNDVNNADSVEIINEKLCDDEWTCISLKETKFQKAHNFVCVVIGCIFIPIVGGIMGYVIRYHADCQRYVQVQLRPKHV